MASVIGRGGGRRRRTMNEINMVPFIDVMLVLLIIFMVSAPLITTGVVDLPSVGKARQRQDKPIEVTVALDENLKLKSDQQEQPIELKALAQRVKQAQAGDDDRPVVISADRNVKYDRVIEVMRELQKAGIQRVGLSVRQGG